MRQYTQRFWRLWLIGMVVLLSACAVSGDALIKPDDKVGDLVLTTMKAVDLSIPPIWAACNPSPQVKQGATTATPGVYNETCSVATQPLLPIGLGWSAATAQRRDENWQALTWEMYLDGRKVDLPAFGTFDADLPGIGPSRIWNVMLDKPAAGAHTLRQVFRLSQDVNDGAITSPAGIYDFTYNFTITAP